jgi:hypothetical protein
LCAFSCGFASRGSASPSRSASCGFADEAHLSAGPAIEGEYFLGDSLFSCCHPRARCSPALLPALNLCSALIINPFTRLCSLLLPFLLALVLLLSALSLSRLSSCMPSSASPLLPSSVSSYSVASQTRRICQHQPPAVLSKVSLLSFFSVLLSSALLHSCSPSYSSNPLLSPSSAVLP